MDKNLVLRAQKLRENGYSYGRIAVEMLITKSQATYLCKQDVTKIENMKTQKEQYEEKVCSLVRKCKSINEICKILGHRGTNEYYNKIKKIIEKYKLDVSHFNDDDIKRGIKEKIPLKEILQENGTHYPISKLRVRLIQEGIKEHKCEQCGLTEWQNKPIPLQLHHINGNRNDNRLENLQVLCPNCHTFTDNYCGRKLKKEKVEKPKKTRPRKRELPSREELLETFKEYGSFSKVGKHFGVSDKGVRLWFGYYDLPIESKEMRQYVREYFGENLKWGFTNGNPDILKKLSVERYKVKCLLGRNDEIEKIYHSNQEIIDDGFNPKTVQEVCNGNLKTHKKRKFAFLKDLGK